ncbi:hypothetical protein L1887_54055 [Cichorium endivia]|nr:hypothetical protein L1887_54055 [Cichorium endivia]
MVLDAGRIAVRSVLADQNALDTVRSKQNRAYTDEDYRQLEDLMYDRFFVKLESAQLVMGNDIDSCMKGLHSNATDHGLHLLERINLDFTLHNSILSSAPNLTKFKMTGHLPTLRVNFSDRKYKTLMRIIDVAIPNFDDDSSAGSSPTKGLGTIEEELEPVAIGQRQTGKDDDDELDKDADKDDARSSRRARGRPSDALDLNKARRQRLAGQLRGEDDYLVDAGLDDDDGKDEFQDAEDATIDKDLLKKSTRTLTCRAHDEGEAPFRFQSFAIYDRQDPNSRAYPRVTLRLRAPVELPAQGRHQSDPRGGAVASAAAECRHPVVVLLAERVCDHRDGQSGRLPRGEDADAGGCREPQAQPASALLEASGLGRRVQGADLLAVHIYQPERPAVCAQDQVVARQRQAGGGPGQRRVGGDAQRAGAVPLLAQLERPAQPRSHACRRLAVVQAAVVRGDRIRDRGGDPVGVQERGDPRRPHRRGRPGQVQAVQGGQAHAALPGAQQSHGPDQSARGGRGRLCHGGAGAPRAAALPEGGRNQTDDAHLSGHQQQVERAVQHRGCGQRASAAGQGGAAPAPDQGRGAARGTDDLHLAEPGGRAVAVHAAQRERLHGAIHAGDRAQRRGGRREARRRGGRQAVRAQAALQDEVRVGLSCGDGQDDQAGDQRARAQRQHPRDRQSAAVQVRLGGRTREPGGVARRARRRPDADAGAEQLCGGAEQLQAQAAELDVFAQRHGVERGEPRCGLCGGGRGHEHLDGVQRGVRRRRHLADQPKRAGAGLRVVPRARDALHRVGGDDGGECDLQVDPDRQPAVWRALPDCAVSDGDPQGRQGSGGASDAAGVGDHAQGRVARRDAHQVCVGAAAGDHGGAGRGLFVCALRVFQVRGCRVAARGGEGDGLHRASARADRAQPVVHAHRARQCRRKGQLEEPADLFLQRAHHGAGQRERGAGAAECARHRKRAAEQRGAAAARGVSLFAGLPAAAVPGAGLGRLFGQPGGAV